MHNRFLLLPTFIGLLTMASAASAGIPQGLPLCDIYCAADHAARSLASELYTPLNTPSTKLQCLGYGMGAGYHAPLVFGRACKWRAERQGLHWLPNSPAPCSHGCGDWSTPSCYAPSCSSGYDPSFEPTFTQPASQQFYSQADYHSGPTLAAPGPQNAVFSPPSMTVPTSKTQPAAQPAPRRPAEPTSPSDANEPESLPMPSI